MTAARSMFQPVVVFSLGKFTRWKKNAGIAACVRARVDTTLNFWALWAIRPRVSALMSTSPLPCPAQPSFDLHQPEPSRPPCSPGRAAARRSPSTPAPGRGASPPSWPFVPLLSRGIEPGGWRNGRRAIRWPGDSSLQRPLSRELGRIRGRRR